MLVLAEGVCETAAPTLPVAEPKLPTAEPILPTPEPTLATAVPVCETAEPACLTTDPAWVTVDPAVETTDPACLATGPPALSAGPAFDATVAGRPDAVLGNRGVPPAPPAVGELAADRGGLLDDPPRPLDADPRPGADHG